MATPQQQGKEERGATRPHRSRLGYRDRRNDGRNPYSGGGAHRRFRRRRSVGLDGGQKRRGLAANVQQRIAWIVERPFRVKDIGAKRSQVPSAAGEFQDVAARVLTHVE